MDHRQGGKEHLAAIKEEERPATEYRFMLACSGDSEGVAGDVWALRCHAVAAHVTPHERRKDPICNRCKFNIKKQLFAI